MDAKLQPMFKNCYFKYFLIEVEPSGCVLGLNGGGLRYASVPALVISAVSKRAR